MMGDGRFKRGHKPVPPTHYGKQKIGKPKADKPRSGPACEICRNLRTGANGEPGCVVGRLLDPVNCPDFKDASKPAIVLWGGTSGIISRI